MPWRAEPATKIEGKDHEVVEEQWQREEGRGADTGMGEVHIRPALFTLNVPIDLGLVGTMAGEI